jgi:hypothetical protein
MRAPRTSKRTRLDALKAVLLTGAAATLLSAMPAGAEQTDGLRGSISAETTEAEARRETARSAGGDGTASPDEIAPTQSRQSDGNAARATTRPAAQSAGKTDSRTKGDAAASAPPVTAVPDPMPTGAVQPLAKPLVPVTSVVNPPDEAVDEFPVRNVGQESQPPPATAIQDGTRATGEEAETAKNGAASPPDDFPTGTVPVAPVEPVTDEPIDPGAQRAAAIEALDRPAEENPYEAPGVRWGSFTLRPTLETGVTATSNSDFSVDGSSAVLSETTLRLNAASDWAAHSASVESFGTFRKTLSGDEIEEVEGGIEAALELEIGSDYRARGTFTYLATPESAASPVVIADAVDEPMTQRIGGTLGLEKDAGKTRFGITGGIGHDIYGDAELEGGGTLSQKDRDATLYTLALRAGYEISPALTPFVETEIGRNAYVEDVDSAGYRRSSDRYALRAGLALDRGEKFSGEIAAGWMREEFDDDRLAPLSAPSLRADVLWSPMRGTDVRLAGSTVLEDTTTPGESGSVLYATSVTVERQMRANLTGNALLGAAWRDYSGSDGEETILTAEAGMTWWLNRYAGVTGRLRHESISSNLPDRDTKANSVFVGLKLQR